MSKPIVIEVDEADSNANLAAGTDGEGNTVADTSTIVTDANAEEDEEDNEDDIVDDADDKADADVATDDDEEEDDDTDVERADAVSAGSVIAEGDAGVGCKTCPIVAA